MTKDDSLPKGAQLFIATLVSCHEVDGVMCAVYFIAAVDVVVIVGPPSSLRLHAKIRASSQANIVDPVAMRNSTMVFVPKDLVAEAVSGLEE